MVDESVDWLIDCVVVSTVVITVVERIDFAVDCSVVVVMVGMDRLVPVVGFIVEVGSEGGVEAELTIVVGLELTSVVVISGVVTVPSGVDLSVSVENVVDFDVSAISVEGPADVVVGYVRSAVDVVGMIRVVVISDGAVVVQAVLNDKSVGTLSPPEFCAATSAE